MARFCATLTPLNSDREISHMGGRLAYCAPPCSLGIVPEERPGQEAGPYYHNSLVAVGEASLFNRSELIKELAGDSPPPPPTSSDGEVLLQFYAYAGLEGLGRVQGMFALAIWDGLNLLLIRDPVGTRTLFYAYAGGCWAVGSSLRALRRWPRLPARLNLAAVRSFLTFAYLPGDETLLEGIHELLPGCYLQLNIGDTYSPAVSVQSYWEPQEQAWDPQAPPTVYAGQLRRLLEATTQTYLPENQAAGVFLSGGIDSSLIAALAAQIHHHPIYTYSINFGSRLPNELAYSDLMAAHCGTRHRILTFSGTQIAAGLAETVAYLDCPVGDPLTVPNLLLSRAAAADGLKVILNGEGGDPCFGGPKNIPMLLFELHRQNPDPVARAQGYLHAYRKCYDYLPWLLSPTVQEALQDAPPVERLVQPYLESDRMAHYLNRLMYTNVRTKGAHHILTKVERLTATCGLEARSPLFDPAVVSYSFAIPPSFKLAGTDEKWVLKLAARDLLPSIIIHRPKSGMRVPVQHWLRGPLRRLVKELLLGPQAHARFLFQTETIQAWLQGEGLLWPRHGSALWLVLTLELWLRAYLDRAEVTPDSFLEYRSRKLIPVP